MPRPKSKRAPRAVAARAKAEPPKAKAAKPRRAAAPSDARGRGVREPSPRAGVRSPEPRPEPRAAAAQPRPATLPLITWVPPEAAERQEEALAEGGYMAYDLRGGWHLREGLPQAPPSSADPAPRRAEREEDARLHFAGDAENSPQGILHSGTQGTWDDAFPAPFRPPPPAPKERSSGER